MSRARHEEKRAKGGSIGSTDTTKVESYSGTGSRVEKEAEKRARGGAMHKGKMPTMVHGSAPKHHANRPGRKSGGAVGADSHPMSSAAKLESRVGGSSSGYKVDSRDD